MLILLSPAKTQDFDQKMRGARATSPVFLAQSEALIFHLRRYDAPAIARLMDISPKLAALNCERYRRFSLPFTPENARQALFLFRGDVYAGLDADSLNASMLERAQASLRILSGLYGILRPLDLIQPYRLEMKTKLPTEAGRTLYEFWGERITQAIAQENASLIVNLASEEYAASVDFASLGAEVVTPQFKEWRGGVYRTIALFAKKARGRMARYLIERENAPLLAFAEDGYRYHPSLSTPEKPVFARG